MTPRSATTSVAEIEEVSTEMLDELAAVVRAESPSTDHRALQRCAAVVAEIGETVLDAAPTLVVDDGVPRLRWSASADPRVLVLGHFDTVWPIGTLAERDFRVEAGRAYGPGVFDMKAGLVQSLYAVAAAGLDGVEVLFTGDEEIGSPTSTRAIQERAAAVDFVLVVEPAAGQALKTERKGTIHVELRLYGRAAHSGLEPEKGVSTTLALGPVIDGAAALGHAEAGTTVVPTLVRSGAVGNAVPDFAAVTVDVRAWSSAELDRVAKGLSLLGATARLEHFEVVVLYRRDPIRRESSEWLFEQAADIAHILGLPQLQGVSVGGCSDGNLAAAAGARTLDGLGAVGGGAHAVDEFVDVSELAPRTALLSGLVAELRSAGGRRAR